MEQIPSKGAQANPDSQPPGRRSISAGEGSEVDLILGIDLGTSCTKVVIGDSGWSGNSFAVPIGKGRQGLERYLRPTQTTVANRVEANLKMRLTASPASAELQNLLALYLAGVIRDSLHWFEEKGSPKYSSRRLVWHLNLGFPAKQVEEGPLVEAYKQISNLAAAAALGPSSHPLELSSIERLRSHPKLNSSDRPIPSQRINIYPEIAAQLAGYVNSPYRAEGNLILIDVGAGTLDVSTAILHGTNHEDVISFHFCDVKPLGALKLLEARQSALTSVLPEIECLPLEQFQSGTRPVPERPSDMVASEQHLNEAVHSAFQRASESFASKAINPALACATQFRNLQREAHANPAFDPWPKQLRFFLTGGGSRLQFYHDHFHQDGPFEEKLSRFTRWKHTRAERRRHQQGLRLESLPCPDDLRNFTAKLSGDFDRLSVAHGLAYGSDNLMEITASVNS